MDLVLWVLQVDAFLLGRRTYVTHAEAFKPVPPGDQFGDQMNAQRKFAVSRTLATPIWRHTTIICDHVVEVRALKAELYPLTLGSGKRIWADGAHTGFSLRSATPYPTDVVGLDYVRQR